MKRQECIETPRLCLRKPNRSDAAEILARYSGDPEVTKFLGWPRHRSLEDTIAFLSFSDDEWARWPAGPYLIESKNEARLLGSTGLSFETRKMAATGYVLAKDGTVVGHGSTRWLWKDEDDQKAICYVVSGQSEPMEVQWVELLKLPLLAGAAQ